MTGTKYIALWPKARPGVVVLRVNPVEPATYAARDDRGDDALQAAAAANAARVAEVAFSPRHGGAVVGLARPNLAALRLILEAGPRVAESAFAWKRVLADHYGAASKEAVAMGSVAARALDLRATGELEALGRDHAKAKRALEEGPRLPGLGGDRQGPAVDEDRNGQELGTGGDLAPAPGDGRTPSRSA